MKRRAITLATKVAVLLQQARCAKCGEILGDDVQWDHTLAHALEGGDGPENIRAVHAECHDIITNGTKATTAGSTKQVVAKVKRLRKKHANGDRAAEVLGEGSAPPVPRPVSKGADSAGISPRGFPKPPPGYQHFRKGRKVGQ